MYSPINWNPYDDVRRHDHTYDRNYKYITLQVEGDHELGIRTVDAKVILNHLAALPGAKPELCNFQGNTMSRVIINKLIFQFFNRPEGSFDHPLLKSDLLLICPRYILLDGEQASTVKERIAKNLFKASLCINEFYPEQLPKLIGGGFKHEVQHDKQIAAK